MYEGNVGNSPRNPEGNLGKFQKLEESTFNSIRNILPDQAITRACKEIQYKYRNRTISPIVTVLHMVLAAIWPEESFNASWQVLWNAAVSKFTDMAGQSPSRNKVAEARKRLPRQLWGKLFGLIAQKGEDLSKSFAFWKRHRVVLVDGTSVSMSDEPKLFEEFGTNTGFHGKGKYPLARIVTLCLAHTMTVVNYAVGGYRTSEWSLLKPMLKMLQKGDLLVGDRHFAAAHYYWHCQSHGLEFLTRANAALKISRIKRLESYSQNDFIAFMKINPIYRKKDSALSDKIMVRFIQSVIHVRGQRQTVWFVTSLLEEKSYPASEIVALYGARWRIETLFREVKIHLSADVLRSKLVDNIYKEIAARFMAVNIVRIIALQAAIWHGLVDPIRISFVHTIRAVLSFSPSFCFEPLWKLPSIYEAMLTEIASNLVPQRVGRNEPRAVRRECKHYPSLKTTRAQWRLDNAA